MQTIQLLIQGQNRNAQGDAWFERKNPLDGEVATRAPAATPADAVAAVEAATRHESWLRTLKQNRWEPSWLTGKDLAEFMELDLTTARVMVYLLKLKA